MRRGTAKHTGARRIVAIHASHRELALAEVVAAARGKPPRLVTLATSPAPGAAAQTYEGPAATCAALLPPLVRSLGLRGRRAVVVLESARGAVRFWAAPTLAPKDRHSCLAFEAERWCQVASGHIWTGILDRLSPPAAQGPGLRPARDEENALAVAAPVDTVLPLLRAVGDAGLEPWAVSVPPLAVESLLALGPVSAGGGAAQVSIHVGAARSCLTVCQDGRLLMVRDLELALDGLASALSLIAVEGQGDVRLMPEEAQRLLERVGVVLEDDPLGMATDRVPLESVKFSLRPALERLTSTISRSLDFCREQFFVEMPETLSLTGEGALVPNLDAYLAKHLQARVEIGLPRPAGMVATPAADAAWNEASPRAALVVGAAVGALSGRVLPARAAAFGLPRWLAVPVRPVLAGLVAALALIWFGISLVAGNLQSRAGEAEHRRVALQEQLATAQLRARAGEATRLERQLAIEYARRNIRIDGVLKILSRAVGADVLLTSLELPSLNASLLDIGTPVAATTGPALPREDAIMTLSGIVRTDRERLEGVLSRLIRELEAAPYFEQVTLVEGVERDVRSAEFKLRCRIVQGLGTAAPLEVVAQR